MVFVSCHLSFLRCLFHRFLVVSLKYCNCILQLSHILLNHFLYFSPFVSQVMFSNLIVLLKRIAGKKNFYLSPLRNSPSVTLTPRSRLVTNAVFVSVACVCEAGLSFNV